MGGNIWKDQSIRLNKNEYFECCNQVEEFLHSTLGIDKKDIFIIEAIKNKDKRMYLRVIKAHISRIFNELDKLKGIYPEYFEKN